MSDIPKGERPCDKIKLGYWPIFDDNNDPHFSDLEKQFIIQNPEIKLEGETDNKKVHPQDFEFYEKRIGPSKEWFEKVKKMELVLIYGKHGILN